MQATGSADESSCVGNSSTVRHGSTKGALTHFRTGASAGGDHGDEKVKGDDDDGNDVEQQQMSAGGDNGDPSWPRSYSADGDDDEQTPAPVAAVSAPKYAATFAAMPGDAVIPDTEAAKAKRRQAAQEKLRRSRGKRENRAPCQRLGR